MAAKEIMDFFQQKFRIFLTARL